MSRKYPWFAVGASPRLARPLWFAVGASPRLARPLLRDVSHHPVGEGLAPPTGFRNFPVNAGILPCEAAHQVAPYGRHGPRRAGGSGDPPLQRLRQITAKRTAGGHMGPPLRDSWGNIPPRWTGGPAPQTEASVHREAPSVCRTVSRSHSSSSSGGQQVTHGHRRASRRAS